MSKNMYVDQERMLLNERAFKALNLIEKMGAEKIAKNRELSQYLIEEISQYSSMGGMQEIEQDFVSYKDSIYRKHAIRMCELVDQKLFMDYFRSIDTAYYTPNVLIDYMWSLYDDLTKDKNMEHINYLDPCCGTNRFYERMPQHLKDKCSYIGIEKEGISAKISDALVKLNGQEKAEIINRGFEMVDIPKGSCDVVLTNFPFGFVKLESKHVKDDFKFVHQFFTDRCMELVKEGGIIGVINSNKILNEPNNERIRRHIASKCNMLGSIMLPKEVFKKEMSIPISCDITFFQKRTKDMKMGDSFEKVIIEKNADGSLNMQNEYYVNHPHMALGTVRAVDKMGKEGKTFKQIYVTNHNMMDERNLRESLEKCGQTIKKSYNELNNNLTIEKEMK